MINNPLSFSIRHNEILSPEFKQPLFYGHGFRGHFDWWRDFSGNLFYGKDNENLLANQRSIKFSQWKLMIFA